MGSDWITEILLRLPVKSIVRFKAVCKYWCSLISDPHFARLHFELAAPRLVFNDYVNPCIRTMDFEGPLHSDHISEPINCDFVSNYDFVSNPIRIEGSCRGFLLMNWNKNLYLWNPSTHVLKPIPSSPIDTNTNVFDHLHGFGYHSSKDDYLVVRVPITHTSSPTHLPDVQFFSLRANMWKYIEGVDLPRMIRIDSCAGLLFSEAIHWTANNWVDFRTKQFIIAFDFMEKRLLEIPQPDGLAHPDVFINFTLWVHGRCFSLSVFPRDGGTLEIWVMKKYKVQTSWTKTLVLSLNCFYPVCLYPVYFYPLCSTKGGDIVMSYSTKLIKFSDEGVQGEELDQSNLLGLLDKSVPMYTESMLSLPDVSE